MAPILYQDEGKEVAERLYEETVEELSFAGVRQIIEGVSD
jgi:hypothetical protein